MMEYVYAALLLHEVGKEINEENLRRTLEATGTQIDEAKLKIFIDAIKGVNIEEVIKSASVQPVAAAPTPAQPKEEKKEEKKEEEKKEVTEEELAEGLAALFG